MQYVLWGALESAITFITALSLGLSLIGSDFVSKFRGIVVIGVLTASVQLLLATFITSKTLLLIYIVLFLFVWFLLKIPPIQALIAIIFAMTFNLLVITLLEYNFLEQLLYYSHVKMDTVMQIVISIFITMNNILMMILIYQKRPFIFENRMFDTEGITGKDYTIYRPLVIFCIILFASLNTFLFLVNWYRAQIPIQFNLFLTLWGLFITIFMIYFIRRSLFYKLEDSRLALNKIYQKEIQSFFGVIRSQRHDFHLHLNAIYGLITKGAYEDSKEYIENVVQHVQKINELLPLSHPATSALLNTLAENARNEGITIHFQIEDNLMEMPCSIYEINKILGNLIQNAFEAVQPLSLSDRVIEVLIARENEQLVFKVTNNTNQNIQEMERMFETGYSTKEAHEGIGLSGVERIVSYYKGIIFPEFTEDTVTIHVRIPLIN